MKNIYDLNKQELTTVITDAKIPKFRAKQIWQWLYVHYISDFNEMNNVDKKTKEFLNDNYFIPNFKVVKHQKDQDGTQKTLIALNDNEVIETVLMKYRHGYSVCVTTQIGCKIGCSFCASHLGGFKRNLSTGEIVAQVVSFARIVKSEEERIGNIVVMGIGEPMDNLENVLNFVEVINDEDGLKIGARHITISTSGIVPKIYEIAEYPKQIQLAISLHASNNEVRSNIMKINNVYPIEELIKSVKHYIDKTNRRVSFEYIMLKGINDQTVHANELADLLFKMNCHVNLIPFNTVEEYTYEKSSNDAISKFARILEKRKIPVTIRQSKGKDIDGACGQLRRKHNNVKN